MLTRMIENPKQALIGVCVAAATIATVYAALFVTYVFFG